jgi:hypothetical protein
VIAVIASGQELTYESMVVHKDGTRIPVEFIVRTMLSQTERVRMTIVRDLRDRRAALARIHPDVRARYYGCGFIAPAEMA